MSGDGKMFRRKSFEGGEEERRLGAAEPWALSH